MNVTFRIGEVLGDTGYRITEKNGLTQFVAENDEVRIHFHTDSGEGKNYSKIIAYTDKHNDRVYVGMRYLHKFVYLVQKFSDVLFDKFRQENPQLFGEWLPEDS